MRFLGNKASILPQIEAVLRDKGLLQNRLSFFDAFCGTGSVADHFKQYYDIILNDNLAWAVTYSRGRTGSQNCSFRMLGFDPFTYLNSHRETRQGFIYKNYSPGGSERMYFTSENAARIDYLRWQIEAWRSGGMLTDDEYYYLLACLIESVSDVSNTAGVYGAYLKKWEPRALKPLNFHRVDANPCPCMHLETHTAKIEDIIEDVDCDILYLDPPYTQNQYGTQYHLLETLILQDEPSISAVTGSRPTAPMRSDWSKDIECHVLLDRVIAKTSARYILFSYNNDGFMSREYIEATLKRYGRKETYLCRNIPYKKYQNWKSSNDKKHFEYLFFIEKKPAGEVIYESPLNYIGNKVRVVPDIKKNLLPGKETFFDLFGGGFNVGINMPCPAVHYVDNNYYIADLIRSFQKYDTCSYIAYVRKQIKQFGLMPGDQSSYLRARDYYNSQPKNRRDPRLLFTIILYGYQQQIRFNGSHEFNNPVGMRWFNDKVLEKTVSFSRKIKECNCCFTGADYSSVEQKLDANSYVYMDPPYQLTTGSYNDGKRGFTGWGPEQEAALFAFADRLTQRGIPFMLSYVKEHKGKTNHNVLKWCQAHQYRLIELGDVLGISGSRRKEVLITNYDTP